MVSLPNHADREPEGLAEEQPQPLIGEMLESLEIDRHAMNPGPEQAARHGLGNSALRKPMALRTAQLKPPVEGHNRRHLRQVHRLVDPDLLDRQTRFQGCGAVRTDLRPVVQRDIRRSRSFAEMPRVPGLRPARLRRGEVRLVIARRRLRRSRRGLPRQLHAQHQFNQLFLARPLKRIALHPDCESLPGPLVERNPTGVGRYLGRSRHRAFCWQRRRQLRQRSCRDHQWPLQSGGDPQARTMKVVRGRRVCNTGMGRLVQSQTPAGAHRQHSTSRSRTKLLRHNRQLQNGRLT